MSLLRLEYRYIDEPEDESKLMDVKSQAVQEMAMEAVEQQIIKICRRCGLTIAQAVKDMCVEISFKEVPNIIYRLFDDRRKVVYATLVVKFGESTNGKAKDEITIQQR